MPPCKISSVGRAAREMPVIPPMTKLTTTPHTNTMETASQILPPEAARKKDVLKIRSIKTMIWDTMNDGNAVKLRITESNTPQTKIGSRPQVMPLVRITITVVMIFMAAIVVETAKTRMVKQYASMPGVNSCTARGA